MTNKATMKTVNGVCTMTVPIPDSVASMGFDLLSFVELMITKLDKNSHKQTVSSDDVLALLGKLLVECGEFTESYHKDLMDRNNELELADIANFAFLIFMVLNKQRKTQEET